MSDKISSKDVIDPKIKEELLAISKATDDVIAKFQLLASVSKQVDTELKKGVTTQVQLNKAKQTTAENTKKVSDVEKDVLKIKEQNYQVLTKMVAEQSKENKTLEETKLKRSEQNKTIKESIALAKTEAGSIARLTAENKKLTKERDAVNTKTVEGQKKIAQLNAKINENNKAINQNKSLLEQQKNNVGNYGSAWDKAKMAVGVFAAGLAAASGAIRFAKSVLESTKNSNDIYQASIQGITGAYDVLKKSIATLSFNHLIDRMREAASAAWDYQMSMNELGDMMRSYKIQEAEARAVTDRLRESMNDETIAIEDRIALTEKLRASEKSLLELRKGILTEISDAEIDKLSAKIGLSKEELKIMLRTYTATKQIREEAVKYNESRNVFKGVDVTATDEERSEAIKKSGALFKAAFEGNKNFDAYTASLTGVSKEVLLYAEAIKLYGNATDVELDKIAQSLIEVANAESEYISNSLKATKKKQSLEKELREDELKLNQETEKEREKALQDYESAVKQMHADAYNSYNENTQKRINLATEEFINGKRSAQALSDEMITITIEETEKKLEYAKTYGLDIIDIETTLTNLKKQLKDAELSDFEKTEEAKRAKAEETAKLTAKYDQQLFDTKKDIGYQLFDLNSVLSERQISKVEEEKEAEIEAAGDNEREKVRIEERYAKRVASIKRQQAITDKGMAIFEIGISTAQAIMKTTSELGLPAAIPFNIATGLLGALQAATVLAKPIPKFFKGTKGFEGGLAEVGERGFELLEMPNNKVGITPDKATTMFLPKGTNVYTHEESKQILANNGNLDISELIKEQRLTRKALANVPIHNTTFDENGMRYIIKRGGQTTIYADKYLRS